MESGDQIIENEISGIEGVERLNSASRDERSQINVEFSLDRDLDSALANRVSRAITGALEAVEVAHGDGAARVIAPLGDQQADRLIRRSGAQPGDLVLVDLEGDVLDADAVVLVSAAVGRPRQDQPAAAARLVPVAVRFAPGWGMISLEPTKDGKGERRFVMRDSPVLRVTPAISIREDELAARTMGINFTAIVLIDSASADMATPCGSWACTMSGAMRRASRPTSS